MVSRRAPFLCLALLAGCRRVDDTPEEAAPAHLAQQAPGAPAPLWHLTLPNGLRPSRLVSIGQQDVILAGWLDDSLLLDGRPFVSRGPWDMLLLRMDPSGHVCWAKQLGAGTSLTSIASNGREVVLSGSFDLGSGARPEHASLIAKLDASGEVTWSKPFANASARRVCIDDAGNVAALLHGNSDPYNGTNVVKLSADGQQRWIHHAWPYDETRDIALTREGDLISVGQHKGRRRPEMGYDFEATIARDDPAGNTRWARLYGARDEKHFAHGVAVDDAGNLFVAQTSGEAISFWVNKYDGHGEHRWSDTALFEDPAQMVPDGAGGVVLWGDALPTGPCLRSLDGDGHLVWSRTLLRTSGEIGGLTRSPSGALLLAGQSHGPFRLDGHDVPASSEPLTGFVAAYRLGTAAGSL